MTATKEKQRSCKARFLKRFVILMSLLWCVTFGILSGGSAARASAIANINDSWGYLINHIDIYDGGIKVDGFFFNNSLEYDIGKMTEFALIVRDADNRTVISIDVDAKTDWEEIVIPSNSTYEYSFTIPSGATDLSANNSSAFYATIHCNYVYYGCRGAGYCSICAPWRSSVTSVPTAAPAQVKCANCDGKGGYDCNLCEDGILYYEKKRSIDIGGGSSEYTVPVRCGACQNGRVRCGECDGAGWYWGWPEQP